MSFETESQKIKSEKILLATLECAQSVKIFSVFSGDVYVRDVAHYVAKVKEGNIYLGQMFGTSLSSGEFYYDPTGGKLYVRTHDDLDPIDHDMTVFYKFFFSNAPLIASPDLDSSDPLVVDWDNRIQSTGSINQELDTENTGIAIETNSSISLFNNDGFFDNIFDVYVWENKIVEIFSYIRGLDISDAKKIFSGIIENKSYGPDLVKFQVKDFTFKLRKFLTMELFDSGDGKLSDATIGSPKRRIYGRMKQVQAIGVDKILKGYLLSETVTGVIADTFITFSASIAGKVFQGDKVRIQRADLTFIEFTIDSFTSNTVAVIGSKVNEAIIALPCYVVPENGHRHVNRDWHIAGHEIHTLTTTITTVNSPRNFELASVEGLNVGDLITINGDNVVIGHISLSNIVITTTDVSPTPSVSDSVFKQAILNAFVENREIYIDRDWTYTTSSTDSILNLDILTEFNLADDQRLIGTNLTFTNGSQAVTSSSATLDLRTILKPRDWVRSTDITHTTYYELMEVNETTLKLVSNFGGTTGAISAQYRNVELIQDDSLITLNCYGMKFDNLWVKTPGDVVKNIVENDAGLTQTNAASFTLANDNCDYIVSMVQPETINNKTIPQIRDVITKINTSVFGSLFTNNDFELCYSILNCEVPTTLASIKDDEIINFSIDAKNNIVRKTNVSYRPFVDHSTKELTYEKYSATSDFTDYVVEDIREKDLILYLYEEGKAQIIANRYCLFNSLSTSTVKVKAKLNLALMVLNDKIYLELDRLYKRYGGNDRRKIGIVSGISKNGLDSDIKFNDLGNIYNRIAVITPNTQVDFTSANVDEIVRYGFIVENDSLTPDVTSEDDLGSNLIG